MPTYNVEDTVGFDVVVQPTVSAVVNAAAGVDITLQIPGAQGPKGDPGATGPAGPAGSTLEPVLTSTDEAGTPLKINAFNGQLVDLTQWKSHDGKILSNIAWDGSVFAPHVDSGKRATKNLLSASQSSLSDMSGWSGYNGNTNFATSTEHAFEGTTSLAMTAVAAGHINARTAGQGSNSNMAHAVVPGHVYTASVSYRAATVSRRVRIDIIWRDATGAFIGSMSGTEFTDKPTGWIQATAVAQAPVNASFAFLSVWVLNCAAGEVHYVDAASLLDTPRANLVVNPDFEDGTANWAANVAGIVGLSTDSYTGGSSMSVTSTTTGLNRAASTPNIPLDGGKYTISAWLKGPAGLGANFVLYSPNGSIGQNIQGGAFTGEWQRFIGTGTLPGGTYGFYIGLQNATAAGQVVLIDSVQVVTGDEVIDYLPPTTHNLLTNPSLEVDLSGWGSYSTAAVTVGRATDRAYVGSASYKMTWSAAGNGGPYINRQVVPVPGRAYTGSVYVSPSKTVGMVAAIEWYAASGTRISVDSGAAFTCPGGDWTRISVTATAPEGAASFVITFYGNGNVWGTNDFCYFDAAQCELGRVATPYVDGSLDNGKWNGSENLVTNSSFETDLSGWEGLNKNLLTANQSSFETDTTGWVVSHNCTLVRSTAQAHHGAGSLSMTAIAGGDMAARLGNQSQVPLVAGQVVTASAWVRSATTARPVYLQIYWADSSGNLIGSDNRNGTPTADNSVGWTQATLTTQVPSGVSGALIRVVVEGAVAGETHYVDSVGLFDTPNGNLVNNPDFEDNMVGWAAVNSSTTASLSTEQSQFGRRSLKLTATTTGGDTYAFQNIKAIAGVTYTISAYLKDTVHTGGAAGNRALFVYDIGAGTPSQVFTTITGTTPGFVRHTVTITPTTNSGLSIRLYSPNGTIFWDGVQVVVGNTAIDYLPPTTHNLVRNPSAETNLAYIGVYAGPSGAGTLTRGTDGGAIGASYARHTWTTAPTAASGGPYFDGRPAAGAFMVEPGRTITLSSWARVNKARRVYIAPHFYKADGSAATGAGSPTFSLAANTWTRISFTTVVPDDAAYVLLAVYAHTDAVAVNDWIDVDGGQIEYGNVATPYVDGSLGAGFSWDSSSNLKTNDSDMEAVTTGAYSTANGSTMAKSTADKWQGTQSMLVTQPTTTIQCGLNLTPGHPVAANTTYTVSAYVRNVDVTNGIYFSIQGAASATGSTILPAGSGWVRMSITFTPTTTAHVACYLLSSGATAGQTFYVDAVQLEQRPYMTPYLQPGTAHASSSTRNQPWVLGGTSIETLNRHTYFGAATGTYAVEVLRAALHWPTYLQGIETRVPVAPNTTYTVSAYNKHTQGTMRVLDGITVLASATIVGGSGIWERTTLTFTTGSGTNSVRIQNVHAHGVSTVRLDAVQLEQRPYVTAFESAGTSGLSTSTRQLAWELGGLADATNVIVPASATERALVMRGASGQTANFLELQNSTASVLASISSAGRARFADGVEVGSNNLLIRQSPTLQYQIESPSITLPKGNVMGIGRGGDGDWMLSLHPNTTSTGMLRMGQLAGQTADVMQVQNSGGTVLTSITASGAFKTLGSDSANGNASIFARVASVGHVTIVARALASQTGDLTQWQSSAGAVIANVTSIGRGEFMNLTNKSNSTDLNTTGADRLYSEIRFQNSNYTVGLIRAVQSNNEYPDAGDLILSPSRAGARDIMRLSANPGKPSVFITPHNNPNQGLVVRGLASQTGNLQEWQNSAGTAVASVTPAGQLQVTESNLPLRMSGPAWDNYIGATGGVNSLSITANGGGGLPVKDSTKYGYSLGLSPTYANAGITLYDHPAGGTAYQLQTWGNGAAASHVAAGKPSWIGSIIRAAASQTADLQQWQDSTGAVLSRVAADGVITAGNTSSSAGLLVSNAAVIGSGYGGSRFGGAMLSISTGATGNPGIVVRGVASQTADLQQWQNSAETVLASVGIVGGAGLISSPYFASGTRIGGTTYSLTTPGASTIGLAVRGSTSQTADLTQWQNSAGAVLASVSASGEMTAPSTTLAAGSVKTTSWTYAKNGSGGVAQTFDFAQMALDSAVVLHVTTVHNSGRNSYVVHATYSTNGKSLVVASANEPYAPAGATFALDAATGKITVTVGYAITFTVMAHNLSGSTTPL